MQPSVTPTAPEPNPAPHQGQDPARTQRFLLILDGLVEMGADLARQLHNQTKTQPQSLEQTAAAFDRTARAVRRAILLAQKLVEPPSPSKPTPHPRPTPKEPTPQPSTPARSAPRRLDTLDRLDSPDRLDPNSAPSLIAAIRRDLACATKQLNHPRQAPIQTTPQATPQPSPTQAPTSIAPAPHAARQNLLATTAIPRQTPSPPRRGSG